MKGKIILQSVENPVNGMKYILDGLIVDKWWVSEKNELKQIAIEYENTGTVHCAEQWDARGRGDDLITIPLHPDDLNVALHLIGQDVSFLILLGDSSNPPLAKLISLYQFSRKEKAFLPLPIVEEPEYRHGSGKYDRDLEAYKEWRLKLVHVDDTYLHLYEDGKVYADNVFKIEYEPETGRTDFGGPVPPARKFAVPSPQLITSIAKSLGFDSIIKKCPTCGQNYSESVDNTTSGKGDEETEFGLLLQIQTELEKAEKLPFAERVKKKQGILDYVTIQRKK